MTRRLLRGSAVLAACALTVLVGAPVHAEDEITIDHVDSADGQVSLLLAVDGLPAGSVPDPQAVSVTLDGAPVKAEAKTVEAGQIARTTILTLDASNSMRGKRFAAAQAAAKAFLAAAPPDVQVGLVTFAGEVQETIAPTSDHDSLAAAVDDIELSSGTGVYDAITQSVNLAGTEGARSVLLLSDGADTGSKATIDDVVASAQDGGVIVDVVSLDQSPLHEAKLTQISDASGGKVIDADPTALSDVFKAQADALASQLLVTFLAPRSEGKDTSVAVTLDVDGTTYSDSAFVALDTAADAPQSVDLGDPLVGRPGMLLGALALGLGLAALLSIVLTGDRGPSDSQRRLSAYISQGQETRQVESGSGGQASIKDTAVALTDKVVNGDFESRLTKRLAGAGSALTASEWLLVHAGIAVAAGFVGLVLRGGAGMFIFFVMGAALPWAWLRRRHSKRLAGFSAQLAETLTLMGGGLSAGLSLPQAIDTVVREGQEPMAGELRRALVEQRLGVDVEEALDGVADRMESQDFAWVVMAIRIQREVGGNLAELLNTVSDTLREREYLRRQVRVLSAEGRMSAWVLGGLPILMFGFLLLTRPEAIRPLYTEFLGIVMLTVASVLLVLGFIVMSKLVKVEV